MNTHCVIDRLIPPCSIILTMLSNFLIDFYLRFKNCFCFHFQARKLKEEKEKFEKAQRERQEAERIREAAQRKMLLELEKSREAAER